MNEVKSSWSTDLGMVDEPTEHPSFLGSREISASNAELNKKRKLQYEEDNLGLPWPKQKFRDRFSSSMQESVIFNSTENNGTHGKEVSSGIFHNTPAQSEESDNNSNNSSTVDDNLMMLDVQATKEKLIFLPNSQTTSSSNISSYTVSGKANEEGTADLEETLQSEPRENATGDGLGASYIDDLEIAQYDMEYGDAVQEDMMLYSNDVAPNAFLFSSERLRLGQDSQTGLRKPTIDQEFEQYFSMLML